MTGPQLSPAPELTEAEEVVVERVDAAEEPEEVTAAKAAAQIPYMMEDTPEELDRVLVIAARRHATEAAALAALRGDRAPLAGQHTTDEEAELPVMIHRGEWRLTADDVRRASAAALSAAEQRTSKPSPPQAGGSGQ